MLYCKLLPIHISPFLVPIESAAKRMSVMGICNKGAGALAPLVMGAFLLKDSDALVERLKTLDVRKKLPNWMPWHQE